MNTHDKAVCLIDTAIKTLAAAKPDLHLVYSNAAYTAANVSHELRAIDTAEFKQYCERIRHIDARFLGLDQPGLAP